MPQTGSFSVPMGCGAARCSWVCSCMVSSNPPRGLQLGRSDPGVAREDVHQLVDLVLALYAGAVGQRLADARIHVRSHDERSRLAECSLSRGDLEQNIDAVAIVLHHSRDPFDLAGDTPQTSDELLLEIDVHH